MASIQCVVYETFQFVIYRFDCNDIKRWEISFFLLHELLAMLVFNPSMCCVYCNGNNSLRDVKKI